MTDEQQLREMNEALLVSSVRQHELAEQAEHAGAAVRDSDARFAALFDASPVGMYLVDDQLRIRLVSRKARPVFGAVGELLGRDFDEVIHILWPLGVADEIVVRFLHTLETGEPYASPEFSEERHDRKVREDYDWQIHRICLPDGRFGVVCYFIDISERLRLTNELRKNAAELAQADRLKDQFLAMLSHELRNPLAAIVNAVQLLQLQQDENELQRQARTIIERQLGQLVHLVDDLLEVSRISTGKIHLRRERLDLRAIVESGIESVRPLIEQRRHALAARLPPEPVWIDGDSTRLEQVVVNLLNNAAKYTDEGGHIWLGLQQEGTEAVLRVRDSGVGIAPELMPHIFDLFTQADRTLARAQGGLGIGLSLVRRLVELHEGTVAAQSVVGKGSELVVRLPVAPAALRRPSSRPAETAQPTGRSARVLMVDDNLDTVRSQSLLLRKSGHDVRTAHDGPTALEVALDFRPDVVLLDIGLPGLDGYEVAKRLRQQPVLEQVVLVAMTGYGQESDRRKSLEAGFDHHLVKPARFEQIQKILATVPPNAT